MPVGIVCGPAYDVSVASFFTYCIITGAWERFKIHQDLTTLEAGGWIISVVLLMWSLKQEQLQS